MLLRQLPAAALSQLVEHRLVQAGELRRPLAHGCVLPPALVLVANLQQLVHLQDEHCQRRVTQEACSGLACRRGRQRRDTQEACACAGEGHTTLRHNASHTRVIVLAAAAAAPQEILSDGDRKN